MASTLPDRMAPGPPDRLGRRTRDVQPRGAGFAAGRAPAARKDRPPNLVPQIETVHAAGAAADPILLRVFEENELEPTQGHGQSPACLVRPGHGMRALTGIPASSLLAAGLLIGGAGPLGARPTSMPPRPAAPAAVAGEARPLAAWVDFCRREPAECVVDTTESATIRVTPRVWETLMGVNHRVNTAIAGVADRDHWAVADRWDVDLAASGDCEDYQLTKRRRLAELGLPRRAMRMAVVVDRQGEGHAVLMLRTDRGDLVLDNKTDSILPWSETGYTYVKRESQDRIGWVRFEGEKGPRDATALRPPRHLDTPAAGGFGPGGAPIR